MNTTGCPEGWATDEVFIYGGAPGRCDMPVPAWIALGLTIVLGKSFIGYRQITLWLQRRRRMRHAQMNMGRTLIPFIPTLGIASFLIYFSFFLTTSLNVSNSGNGWAAGLYSMGWVVFGSMSIFYFLKMLRLGKKLIPLSRKVLANPGTPPSSRPQPQQLRTVDEMVHGDDLGKFDTFGRILFILELVAVVSQVVLFLIIGVAVDHSFTIALVGFGVMALFLFVHTLSILWLMERTIQAVKRSQYKDSSSNAGNNDSGTRSTMRPDIRAILRKMREQQFIIIVLASTGGLVYVLIVSMAIPTAWYVILIHMFYDMVANFVIVHSMGRKMQRRQPGQNQNARSPQVNAPRPDRELTSFNTNRDSARDMTVNLNTNQKATANIEATSTCQLPSKQKVVEEEIEPKSDHFVIVFQSYAEVEDDNDNSS